VAGARLAREAEELARTPYRRQIAMLRERAAQKGKTLVVRDWVTVNFLPNAGDCVAPKRPTRSNRCNLEGAA
jgi:aminoglycoside/choline kinase family phosphotransferase